MKKSPSGIAPVIAIRRNAKTPIHRQIYEAYRAAIIAGNLRPGQRIPSTRVLADELGVSRFPVLNAHAQLLAEGYLVSRVGAGTVVSDVLTDHHGLTEPPAVRQSATRRTRSRRVSERSQALPSLENTEWVGGWGAFGVGQVAIEHFPLRLWSSLVNRCWRQMDPRALHYGDAMGSPRLRQVVANYLNTARSLRCDAEQVMIVSGSQQALELSARILLDPGDSIWMEEPGYRLARDAFFTAGLRVIPVPVDEEGLKVAAGIKFSRKAKAVYVTPSHQFPLGFTMSAARRLSLLDWAQRNGSWIIEDDYDSEFRYESPPVAAMQGIDTDGRVIYIGTFSKVLFPSLRIGYLVIPADLVDRFRDMRRVMDLAPTGSLQEVLAEFIDEGHFERHIRRMRHSLSRAEPGPGKEHPERNGIDGEYLGQRCRAAPHHHVARTRARHRDSPPCSAAGSAPLAALTLLCGKSSAPGVHPRLRKRSARQNTCCGAQDQGATPRGIAAGRLDAARVRYRPRLQYCERVRDAPCAPRPRYISVSSCSESPSGKPSVPIQIVARCCRLLL
jgi:GntR family transcriptional regulator/MocR family aminotransferase